MLITFTMVVMILAALAEVSFAAPGTWSPTGPLNFGRYNHTATLLPNGKVLVVGGYYSGYHADVELYDPALIGFNVTYSLNTARCNHTATLLPNGKVLVVGGEGEDGSILASAELYDPASGWSATASMGTVRRSHSATLLLNGKVLVAGGYEGFTSSLASAELYDPVTGTWSSTGSMNTKRLAHPATLLLSGKVLVAGGFNFPTGILNAPELYDPVSGNWSSANLMCNKREDHTATRLLNGKVLVAGGLYTEEDAELYEPEPPPKVQLPPLLAFYPMEGNAQDLSGHGHHGTVTGSPLVWFGWEGSAYFFNGTTDYITVPLDINPEKYPKLTMGCWAKTTSLWPLQQLLTHDDGDFDRSIGIDLRGNGVGWSAFCGSAGLVLGAASAFLDDWTFVAVV